MKKKRTASVLSRKNLPKRALKTEISSAVKNRKGHEVTVRSSSRQSRIKHKSFPIVGIGASAGGLEAFTQLIHHLPSDSGMAFVLVQHLDPKHESMLKELLSKSDPDAGQ